MRDSLIHFLCLVGGGEIVEEKKSFVLKKKKKTFKKEEKKANSSPEMRDFLVSRGEKEKANLLQEIYFSISLLSKQMKGIYFSFSFHLNKGFILQSPV